MRNFWLGLMFLLSACGGGGSGGSTAGTGATGTTGSGTQTSSSCSLRMRQDFVLAALQDNYLFPETLPASLDPAQFSTLSSYVDGLTATARSQRRDRFFTFVTSIADENAFFASGSSAGFGIRVSTDATAGKTFVSEAFEGAPALAAGIDRGTEIVAIGDTPSNLRDVSAIISAQGAAGVSAALGPSTAGLTRTLRITDASGTRDVTVTKANYDLIPVSARYGAQVINDAGRKVAYLNLRTFISSADPQLRAAFDQFRAQGVTDFIIDFRYNGGGLVSTAELIGDLLGANRSTSDVLAFRTFKPEKSSQNSTRRFAPQPQSVAPVRIAFITTGATASASELVINAMTPYLGANEALIGANSFGKPVGQIGIDRAACDDRLRVVAFSEQNAANAGFYYDGLAGRVGASCAAGDDLKHPLGDPQEASVRQALDFIAGKSCTPITASGAQTSQSLRSVPELMTPSNPTTAQREVPGLF